jgi:hypothetical protein
MTAASELVWQEFGGFCNCKGFAKLRRYSFVVRCLSAPPVEAGILDEPIGVPAHGHGFRQTWIEWLSSATRSPLTRS